MRTLRAAFLVLLATFPAAASPAPEVVVGLVVDAGAAEPGEVATAVRIALDGASVGARVVELLERAPDPDRAVLRDAFATAEVVVGVGEESGRAVAESIRDRFVIAVLPGAAPASGDRVRVVATTIDPAEFVHETLRLLGREWPARRIAVVGPDGGAAEAIVAAARGSAPAGATVERLRRSATHGGYVPGDADVVFASPDTPASDVTELARGLVDRRTALVGSRADHLDAGAALVLRTSATDAGALAASACLEAVRGARWGGGVRRPRRIVHEVHLGNARRLGFRVPVAALASSDLTLAPAKERR